MKKIGYVITDLYDEVVSKVYAEHQRPIVEGRIERMNSSFAERPYKLTAVYIDIRKVK